VPLVQRSGKWKSGVLLDDFLGGGAVLERIGDGVQRYASPGHADDSIGV
jgi:hypothetical protein